MKGVKSMELRVWSETVECEEYGGCEEYGVKSME
jgi:hypothetical protein